MKEREGLKMSETLQIIIAGLVILAVGIPCVIKFDKWKKEMEDADDAKGDK